MFFTQLPLIALALLLTKIEALNGLPHLQWPIQAPELLTQKWMFKDFAGTGHAICGYFAVVALGSVVVPVAVAAQVAVAEAVFFVDRRALPLLIHILLLVVLLLHG